MYYTIIYKKWVLLYQPQLFENVQIIILIKSHDFNKVSSFQNIVVSVYVLPWILWFHWLKYGAKLSLFPAVLSTSATLCTFLKVSHEINPFKRFAIKFYPTKVCEHRCVQCFFMLCLAQMIIKLIILIYIYQDRKNTWHNQCECWKKLAFDLQGFN